MLRHSSRDMPVSGRGGPLRPELPPAACWCCCGESCRHRRCSSHAVHIHFHCSLSESSEGVRSLLSVHKFPFLDVSPTTTRSLSILEQPVRLPGEPYFERGVAGQKQPLLLSRIRLLLNCRLTRYNAAKCRTVHGCAPAADLAQILQSQPQRRSIVHSDRIGRAPRGR